MLLSLVTLLWFSLACVTFSYLGYPLLLCLITRGSPRQPISQDDSLGQTPNLIVLIAAHNAEQHIAQRIDNILTCDYPPHKIKIYVASDGSNDATVDIVRGFDDPRIRVFDFAERRGKAMTLVAAVRELKRNAADISPEDSPILLFTDVTTRFETHAIRRLIRNFGNPSVGIVAGQIRMVDGQGQPAESLYWKCEMLVRAAEAKLGIMLGASGAMYAMRLALFVEPERPIINDDLVFPTLAHIRSGCAVMLDDSACAFSPSGSGLRGEFQRRCRIGAGAYQCLPVLRELWQWRHIKHAAAFTAHKLLRWISPFLLIAAFLATWGLCQRPEYRLLLAVQVAAYVVAICGIFATGRGPIARAARTAASFLVMNLALLAGCLRWLRNPHNVIWNPTPRHGLRR